jgi:hypothetical protein
MSNYPKIAKTLIALSGQGEVITVYRAFVEYTGSLEAAMMLSQLLYWTPRSSRKNGSIIKSDAEFAKELYLSIYGVRCARRILENKRIVETRRVMWKGAPTMSYLVKIDELENSFDTFLRIRKIEEVTESEDRSFESVSSLTETTTEITTEIKETSAKPALSPVKAPPIPVSKPIKEKPIPKENNNYAMAQALADVSGMNFVVNKGRLFKNAKELLKVPGITPDDIRRDYGEGGDWYRYDWRGKQGEKPTPEAVRATLGNLKIAKPNGGQKYVDPYGAIVED